MLNTAISNSDKYFKIDLIQNQNFEIVIFNTQFYFLMF